MVASNQRRRDIRSRHMLRVLAVAALALGGLPPVGATQTVCFPNALGVPAAPGPPQWWTTPPDKPFAHRIDDPRWNGSWASSFSSTVDDVRLRALEWVNGGSTSLLLSWQISVDPSLDADTDSLFVGFKEAGTAAPIVIGVKVYAAPSDRVADPAADFALWRWTTAGTWQQQSPFTPSTDAPWLADTKVWVEVSTHKWGVNMRVPVSTAGLSSGLNLPDPFQFWSEAQVAYSLTTGGFAYVPYAWGPVPSATGVKFPDPSTWRSARLTPDPSCGNVTITASGIGSTNVPSSEIRFTTPPAPNNITNTLFAKPTNLASVPIAANAISATLLIANWGSQPDWNQVSDPSKLWKEIEPATPKKNQAQIGGLQTADDMSDIRFAWLLDECTRYEFVSAAPPSTCIGSEKRWLHQCMQVRLSGPGIQFVSASVYRNMDFVSASRFERDAEITIRGLLPSAGGGQDRTMYLYTELFNMPSRVTPPGGRGAVVPQPSPQPGRERRPAGTTPAAPAAAGGGQADSVPIPVDSLASYPTYRVHVYRETGDSALVGGVWRRRVEPQTPFGYYVRHDGALIGWRTVLSGAEPVGPNLYRVRVANNGSVTVRTTIQAVGHWWELVPTLWWIVAIVVLLLLIAWRLKRTHA